MTVSGKKYVDCTIFEGASIMSTEAAEDSSYDSDYDAEESSSSTAINSLVDKKISSSNHSDVSRTTSDTLAAEFAEYVTIQSKSSSSSSSLQSPDYKAKVEFALKLGYTERLVQIALEKLGPNPEQNELLAELIRLGASSSSSLNYDDDYEYKNNNEILNDGFNKTVGSSCSSYGLRPVVIDGSNVAMSHGNKKIFSCRGIKICVDWFRSRGHNEITVFVPKWRKETSRPDNPIAEQDILVELERDRLLVFTPSRLVGGKRMVCYDDRYILRLAAELNGIVVSNDNYRDLAQENPEFRRVVEERILMYSFVNDRFMPPDDPLGRSGPTLDNFLRMGNNLKKAEYSSLCPYAKKCTYGNKCKFLHPERGIYNTQKTITEKLFEHAQRHLHARGTSFSLPPGLNNTHKPLLRTKSSAHSSGANKSVIVPKSKSVENVTDGTIAYPIIYQKISPTQNQQGPVGWQTSRVTSFDQEPVNMHRKLQRQLTLNPACDPRLYQLRRFHQQHQNVMSSSLNNPQHRPLTRHTSNENYPAQLTWEASGHQEVTRIASAPDSYRAWPLQTTNQTISRLGTSDPQLNILQPSSTSTSTTTTTTIVNNHHAGWNISQTHDERRRIHYHLANIFPEEQVQTVMTLNPHETDPKKICALILTMFPKL